MGVISLKLKKPVLNLEEFKSFKSITLLRSKIKDERLVAELKKYMENEYAYLQPDINLTNVSRILGTNRSYLSAIINHHFGMNFNTYVNRYRVNYVIDYIEKYPFTSKDELVQLSGFGSKSTMHRAMNKLKDNKT